WSCYAALYNRVDDVSRWRERLWLMCAAWPGVIFFIVLSFFKPVVPSWPLPHFVPLVALVAAMAAIELVRYRNLISRWQVNNSLTRRGRKPDTAFHRLWFVLVVYGLAGWL